METLGVVEVVKGTSMCLSGWKSDGQTEVQVGILHLRKESICFYAFDLNGVLFF